MTCIFTCRDVQKIQNKDLCAELFIFFSDCVGLQSSKHVSVVVDYCDFPDYTWYSEHATPVNNYVEDFNFELQESFYVQHIQVQILKIFRIIVFGFYFYFTEASLIAFYIFKIFVHLVSNLWEIKLCSQIFHDTQSESP